MPVVMILVWVQVSCIAAWSGYGGPQLHTGEGAWLLHP